MSSKQFQIGDVVRHRRRGVGQVTVAAETIRVEYATGESKSSPPMPPEAAAELLEKLQEDSPEARLLHFPETLNDWAVEAPVRLVATALSIHPSSKGTAGQIKKSLAKVKLEQAWESWWGKKMQPAVKEATDYFATAESGKDLVYLLKAANIFEIPAIPLAEYRSKRPNAKSSPKAGDPKEWEAWLSSVADASPPADFPHSAFIKGIATKPKKFPEHALLRAAYGANDALSGKKIERPDAWLNMLTAATRRWNGEFGKTGVAVPSGVTAASFVLWRAIPVGKGRKNPKRDAIREFVSLTKEESSVKRALIAEVWSLLLQGSEDVDGLRQEIAQALDRNGQAEFWHEIIAAGLNAANANGSARMIALILGCLKRRDDAGYRQVLHLLLLKAARGEIADRDALLECLRDDSPFWLSGLLMLNSDNERSLIQGAERIYAGVAYGGDLNAMESWDDENAVKAELNNGKQGGPEDAFRELTKHVGNRIDAQKRQVRESFQDRLDEQKTNHQEELKIRDRQFARYRNDVAQLREKSYAEIRKDLLDLISDTLRLLNSGDREVSARLRGAQAILTLALRAGGGDLQEVREFVDTALSTTEVSGLQEAN